MSDNFIPLNQSTPVHHQWNLGEGRQDHNNSGFRNNHFQNRSRGKRGQGNKWGNNTRNSCFSSDNNSYSNNSYSNRTNIDAYLHPSMLQDPWAQLRKRKEEGQQV